jgi:HK97 family phage major capsid protein
MSSTKLREKLNEGDRRVRQLLEQAQTEQRELTDDEQRYCAGWLGDDAAAGVRDDIQNQLDKALASEADRPQPTQAMLDRLAQRSGRALNNGLSKSVSGVTCRVIDKPLSRSPVQNALGELCLGLVAGTRNSPAEIRNALSTSSNPAGGYLVPDIFSSEWIDYARAQSVVLAAGARLIEMSGNTLLVPTLDSDPTFASYAELATTNDSDPTFGSVNLGANTVRSGCIASRELIEDSPLASEMISASLLRGLVAAVDKAALQGMSGWSFLGLCSHASISETGSVGAIQWEDLIAAVAAVRSNNFQPTAIICSPTIYSDLYSIASGDAVNAQKGWVPPPLSVADIPILATSSMPDSKIIVGDFSQLLFGVRSQPLLEASVDAQDAFERHGVRFKSTWRGDYAVARPSAFYRLAGVTT